MPDRCPSSLHFRRVPLDYRGTVPLFGRNISDSRGVFNHCKQIEKLTLILQGRQSTSASEYESFQITVPLGLARIQSFQLSVTVGTREDSVISAFSNYLGDWRGLSLSFWYPGDLRELLRRSFQLLVPWGLSTQYVLRNDSDSGDNG